VLAVNSLVPNLQPHNLGNLNGVRLTPIIIPTIGEVNLFLAMSITSMSDSLSGYYGQAAAQQQPGDTQMQGPA
jgi:hypothetical protein